MGPLDLLVEIFFGLKPTYPAICVRFLGSFLCRSRPVLRRFPHASVALQVLRPSR